MSVDMGHHSDIMKKFGDSEIELMSSSHRKRGVLLALCAAEGFRHTQPGVVRPCVTAAKVLRDEDPRRPIDVAEKWNELVYEELFYAEGDVDSKVGREVHPLHNMSTNNNQHPEVDGHLH
jgi:hypothetical protein